MRNDHGNLIRSLEESLKDLFKETILERICNECGKNRRFKITDRMSQSAKVLVVQYMHFPSGGSKIWNKILS